MRGRGGVFGRATTMATGEEGGGPTTMATGQEDIAAFDQATSGELCLTMVQTLMKGTDGAAVSANK